ncbi:sodium:calcium antiporter [Chloroflexota bacterium]
MVWIEFTVCVLIIFFAGRQVARYGDIIAERTGLGRVWIGVILIALITSLPELFTGISAVTLVNAPDLAVGDLIGANSFNLFNMALLDIFNRNGSLLTNVSITHRLTGWLSIAMILLVVISIILSFYIHPMALFEIGWYTPAILLLYLYSVKKISSAERNEPYTSEPQLYTAEAATRKIILYFSIAAAFIIGAGIWLAIIGSEISTVTGLGHSFVGSLFLAFTTTLPEITVSFTAIRIGAKDMAVANLIGSNLFNLTIIPITDLFYRQSPLLDSVSLNHLVTAAAVILMTIIFIIGLKFHPKRYYRLSWWNLSLIMLFLIAVYFNFIRA